MTARETFERGTNTFNAHDIDGFRAVLADDVVFEAPGVRGQGKTACAGFFGSWFVAFPDAHVEVNKVHIFDDIAVEEGTFTGAHYGVLPAPAGEILPTGRSVRVDYIQVIRFRDGKHSSFHLVFDRMLILPHAGAGAWNNPSNIKRNFALGDVFETRSCNSGLKQAKGELHEKLIGWLCVDCTGTQPTSTTKRNRWRSGSGRHAHSLIRSRERGR